MQTLIDQASASLRAGDHDAALGFARTAIRADPSRVDGLVYASFAARELGRVDEALTFARLAVEMAPRAGMAHAALAGALLVDQPATDAAYWAGRRAVELSPRSPSAQLALARAAEQSGRVDQARRSYSDALDLDPGLETAQAGLDRIDNPQLPELAEPVPVESVPPPRQGEPIAPAEVSIAGDQIEARPRRIPASDRAQPQLGHGAGAPGVPVRDHARPEPDASSAALTAPDSTRPEPGIGAAPHRPAPTPSAPTPTRPDDEEADMAGRHSRNPGSLLARAARRAGEEQRALAGSDASSALRRREVRERAVREAKLARQRAWREEEERRRSELVRAREARARERATARAAEALAQQQRAETARMEAELAEALRLAQVRDREPVAVEPRPSGGMSAVGPGSAADAGADQQRPVQRVRAVASAPLDSLSTVADRRTARQVLEQEHKDAVIAADTELTDQVMSLGDQAELGPRHSRPTKLRRGMAWRPTLDDAKAPLARVAGRSRRPDRADRAADTASINTQHPPLDAETGSPDSETPAMGAVASMDHPATIEGRPDAPAEDPAERLEPVAPDDSAPAGPTAGAEPYTGRRRADRAASTEPAGAEEGDRPDPAATTDREGPAIGREVDVAEPANIEAESEIEDVVIVPPSIEPEAVGGNDANGRAGYLLADPVPTEHSSPQTPPRAETTAQKHIEPEPLDGDAGSQAAITDAQPAPIAAGPEPAPTAGSSPTEAAPTVEPAKAPDERVEVPGEGVTTVPNSAASQQDSAARRAARAATAVPASTPADSTTTRSTAPAAPSLADTLDLPVVDGPTEESTKRSEPPAEQTGGRASEAPAANATEQRDRTPVTAATQGSATRDALPMAVAAGPETVAPEAVADETADDSPAARHLRLGEAKHEAVADYLPRHERPADPSRRHYRVMAERERDAVPSWFLAAVGVLAVLVAALTMPIGWALAVAAIAALVGVWWLTRAWRRSDSDLAPDVDLDEAGASESQTAAEEGATAAEHGSERADVRLRVH